MSLAASRPVMFLAALLGLLEAGAPAAAWADALAERLEPHVGEVLDLVEVGTGRRFVRPWLEKVVTRDGATQSLRLVEEGQNRPTSILLKGSIDDLVAAFGGAIGVPGLKP
jgi:hypothetical protein